MCFFCHTNSNNKFLFLYFLEQFFFSNFNDNFRIFRLWVNAIIFKVTVPDLYRHPNSNYKHLNRMNYYGERTNRLKVFYFKLLNCVRQSIVFLSNIKKQMNRNVRKKIILQSNLWNWNSCIEAFKYIKLNIFFFYKNVTLMKLWIVLCNWVLGLVHCYTTVIFLCNFDFAFW